MTVFILLELSYDNQGAVKTTGAREATEVTAMDPSERLKKLWVVRSREVDGPVSDCK